ERAALLALLGRKFVSEQAVRMVLFQEALADQLGLNTTDLLCLSFLNETAPLTAGQLAEATGLTTGSVTIMIDRLEKAGYAQRAKDPTDRRRVIVRPVTERIAHDITPLYVSLAEAWGRAVDHYSTDELTVILDMLTRSVVLLQEQTTALRHGGREHAVPIDTPREAAGATSEQQVHEARLLFLNGAFNVTVSGADLRGLYHARFEAPEPQVHAQGGAVQIRYPRFPLFQRGRGKGTIMLSTAARWQIELRGGVSDCTFDVRDVPLGTFTVFDGAFRLDLTLGHPRGRVPIHIAGGAADITIRRPAATAARVTVRGGATRLQLDERYAEIVRDAVPLQTPNYAGATDYYDITVEGGASSLSVMS
ncbi:MAG: hypothetical protein AVDCRST_MAG93-2053, partial [uncultured Chloroflexia bacterium]